MIKQAAAQLHKFFHKQTTPVLVAVKIIEMWDLNANISIKG